MYRGNKGHDTMEYIQNTKKKGKDSIVYKIIFKK